MLGMDMQTHFTRCARPVTTWPSGLRRQIKALIHMGVGSNPTVVSFASDADGHHFVGQFALFIHWEYDLGAKFARSTLDVWFED